MAEPHHDPSITLRPLTVADAPTLATFARRVFDETFAADNDPADLATYLDRAFGDTIQRTELAEANVDAFVIEQDGAWAGYTLVRHDVPHRLVPATSPLYLQRFYVDRRWHGRGVASMLMDAVVTLATHRHHDVIWLTTWERNARALRFYAKQGFEDIGGETFLLGTDLQDDRVLAKRLVP